MINDYITPKRKIAKKKIIITLTYRSNIYCQEVLKSKPFRFEI